MHPTDDHERAEEIKRAREQQLREAHESGDIQAMIAATRALTLAVRRCAELDEQAHEATRNDESTLRDLAEQLRHAAVQSTTIPPLATGKARATTPSQTMRTVTVLTGGQTHWRDQPRPNPCPRCRGWGTVREVVSATGRTTWIGCPRCRMTGTRPQAKPKIRANTPGEGGRDPSRTR